jgi:protocatechuate 3,4-dioxygenase beta subunit
MTPNYLPRILSGCCLAMAAAAQPAAQYSLAGTVINSLNGEPIKRAQIMLLHFNVPDPRSVVETHRLTPDPPLVTSSTFTDSAGVFRFSGLSPGQYTISAQKPGFTPMLSEDSPRTIQMNLTDSMEDVRLSLLPLGVITGKVLDQEAQPLRGLVVAALTQHVVEGWRHTETSRSVTTDDRGIYRFWNLSQGKYYIQATGKSGGTYLYSGDTAPRYTADEAFAPTYVGGGKTLSTAQPVDIGPGTEAAADLNVSMEPARKIRGALANFAPRRTVKFELSSGDEVSASRVSVNGDTGVFEIQDVIPGSYTLRATQGETSAEITVNVAGADVNGLVITLSPGVEIKVHRQLANPPKEDEAAARHFGTIDKGGSCSVSLHPPGRRASPSYSTNRAAPRRTATDAKEELILSGVLPGAYRAMVQCYGSFASSVMFGTQDLLANPVLTIQPGVAPPLVEIVAIRGGGTVTGSVAIESGKKRSQIGILLVPQFMPSTGPVVGSAINFGDTPFHIGSLAPGSYSAYAFSSIDEVEYRNPTFLQSLTGGVSVQVEDNTEKNIKIMELAR